jgi:hypothetical protein
VVLVPTRPNSLIPLSLQDACMIRPLSCNRFPLEPLSSQNDFAFNLIFYSFLSPNTRPLRRRHHSLRCHVRGQGHRVLFFAHLTVASVFAECRGLCGACCRSESTPVLFSWRLEDVDTYLSRGE